MRANNKYKAWCVVRCPVDDRLHPPAPAYDERTEFSTLDMAGLLRDGYAPCGMVVKDWKGRYWITHYDSEIESGTQILIRVHPYQVNEETLYLYDEKGCYLRPTPSGSTFSRMRTVDDFVVRGG